MLLPRHTGRTILAHAGTAAKAQGAKQRGPNPRFALQPANDMGRSFKSGVLYTVRVSESTRSRQAKHNMRTAVETPVSQRYLAFRDRVARHGYAPL